MIKQTRGAWKLFGLAMAASAAFLAGSAQASTITWNVPGGAGGTWDTTSPNWTGDSTYFTSDGSVNVIFDATGGGGTISISADMLPSSTTVSDSDYTFTDGPIDGGSLTNNGPGTLSLYTTPANFSSVVLNGGTLYVQAADYISMGDPFNINNVTINSGATLEGERAYMVGGTLTMNGGTWWEDNGFAGGWTGPVYLGADSFFGQNGWCMNQTINGDISGPGGFTFSTQYGAILTLNGANTYAGPTIVTGGTLKVKSSLYGNDTSKWTPANITLASGAGLVLSVGGAGEFTGTQAGTLFASLSTVNNNGLQAGSAIGYDTGDAGATVTISATLADSTGTGGGAVGLSKFGSGTLALTGANTYSGQTVMEGGGTLQVSSFNSVVGGTASSSLGAPTIVDNGTIQIGKASWAGGTLRYTGTGETTDRVIFWGSWYNNCTLDQSGTGLLKFTSPFVIAGGSGGIVFDLQGSTAGSGEIAGGIPDTDASLTKSGTGTWTLSGVNAYTGSTTVNGGNLVIGGAGQLGGGDYAADISLSATTATLTYNSSAAQTLSGVISGPGGLTQAGPGTLTLTGANTYTGTTTVTAGELDYDSPDALGSSGLSLSAGGKVALNYVGAMTIPSLFLDGVGQTVIGTYGQIGSGADVESAYFTGPGYIYLPTPTYTFKWKGADGANWSDVDNWNDWVPGAGDTAVFSDTASAGANVNLDTDVTVAGLIFNNLVANQTIESTGGSTLTLDNSGTAAGIETDGGSPNITAAINAPANIAVSGPASATLNLNGAITSLTSGSWDEELINGPNVVLNGTASWTAPGCHYMAVGSPIGATLTINDSATVDWSGAWDMYVAWNTGDTGKIVQNGGTVITPPIGTAWFDNNGPGVQLGGAGDPVTAEYDLNGGTLITPNVYNVHDDGAALVPPTGSAVFRFNGGVLQGTQNDNFSDPDVVAEGSTYLMGNLTHAYVGNNGAKVDTAGFTCSIDQALEHDPSASAIDGGLTKLDSVGGGTLTLLRASTYTGPTKVQAGVLACVLNNALGGGALDITTGAMLQLDYTGTRTVSQLTFDAGAPQATGTWGSSSAVPAPTHIDDTHFAGTGTVTVGSLPPPEFPASGFTYASGGTPTFTFPTTAGHSYQLFYTDDLSGTPTWTAIGSPTPGDGSPLTLTDTSTPPLPAHRFYKLGMQ